MIIDKPSPTRQHDFDAFWEQTLSECAEQPFNATLSANLSEEVCLFSSLLLSAVRLLTLGFYSEINKGLKKN